jgi:hypothetical protein
MEGPISLGTVSGSDYTRFGEFSDYSWHGLVEGFYEGFVKLPYDDPNIQVRTWLADLLGSNKLISDSEADLSLNVFVQRLKINTQRTAGFDYRACLVNLRLTVLDRTGSTVREATVEGLAKLKGSDLVITGREAFSIRVAFSPDEPPVCKLAIANAIRGKRQ